MNFSSRYLSLAFCFLCSCSADKVPQPEELYFPARRQSPPPPVYSRLMWGHPPAPTPLRSKNDAPYLSPTISFELSRSNLEEAVEALAQTLGYRWFLPSDLASRPVSLKFVGTADQIIAKIAEQAGVIGEIDHEQRTVRVSDQSMAPQLNHPQPTLPGYSPTSISGGSGQGGI